MKIRIGFGLGTRTSAANTSQSGDSAFGSIVDALETLGFDSLWVSERVGGDAPDPVAAMAYAFGRTERLKCGMSVMVLPGRSPVLVAKSMATLDQLSGGRLLPAFGLGVADPHEQHAFGVERAVRARMFDEALPLMRRLWREDDVEHHGDFYDLDRVTVRPRPAQGELDVWLGGIAGSELRRVGRLGDGWLPSFCDADDIKTSIPVINQVTADADRQIDPEHMGALVAYRHGELPDIATSVIGKRRPDKDPTRLIPRGFDGLTRTLEEMLDAGASKFVLLPLAEPDDWDDELGALAEAVLPLQT